MASYRKNYKSARKEAKTFSQKHHECDSISSQNRLSVAHDSQEFCSVGERILLFQQVKNEGIIEELLDTLRSMVRIQSGRNESPSMGIIDSRNVKTSHHVDSVRGLDGNKKIKGRKQHIIVDSQGYLMSVAVHEANVHDSKGAPKVIERLSYKFPRLAKILADGGYRGSLADWVFDKFKWELEVVLRPDECPSKLKVIPKRWIVERAFAWLENFRRLTIDYEFHADTAETMVQLAFCKIMLNKIIV